MNYYRRNSPKRQIRRNPKLPEKEEKAKNRSPLKP
jgi:hypothetical protein